MDVNTLAERFQTKAREPSNRWVHLWPEQAALLASSRPEVPVQPGLDVFACMHTDEQIAL